MEASGKILQRIWLLKEDLKIRVGLSGTQALGESSEENDRMRSEVAARKSTAGRRNWENVGWPGGGKLESVVDEVDKTLLLRDKSFDVVM